MKSKILSLVMVTSLLMYSTNAFAYSRMNRSNYNERNYNNSGMLRSRRGMTEEEYNQMNEYMEENFGYSMMNGITYDEMLQYREDCCAIGYNNYN